MYAFASLLQTKTASSLSSLSVLRLADMDATTAYSLQRCKILHLVRHGQGIHNVEGEKGNHVLLSEELFDAKLSPLGWQQVDNLRKHVQSRGLDKKVDLVVTSPMSRTLQTALGVFGSGRHQSGDDVDYSMPENDEKWGQCAKSTLNGPPIVAVELCRERLGIHPCDRRRSISEYRSLFPVIDFKLIENEDDNLWKSDAREDIDEVVARGINFIKWLWTRQEKEIAVVSHGIFLQHFLIALLNDCYSSPKSKLCTRFQNCEVRSVVIVDRGTMGSRNPGKISGALHLPTDENISREEVTK